MLFVINGGSFKGVFFLECHPHLTRSGSTSLVFKEIDKYSKAMILFFLILTVMNAIVF